jgi:hypothetical protein
MTGQLKSPEGVLITGTLEKVRGVAELSGVALIDGKYEPEYCGNTDMDWDSQTSVLREGQVIYIDENGMEWLASECVFVPDP